MTSVVDPVRSFLELEKRLGRGDRGAGVALRRRAGDRVGMVPGAVLTADAELAAEPFGALGIAVARLFPG